MTPQLSYIAELTQPSFVSLVIMKSTQRTSSSPSTLVHCSVMPVTHPLYQSSVKQSTLFFAKTATGKDTVFLLCLQHTFVGRLRVLLGVLQGMN